MARDEFRRKHLEELRKRVSCSAIGGVGVAFCLCLVFSDQLWYVVVSPATAALTKLPGVKPATLV